MKTQKLMAISIVIFVVASQCFGTPDEREKFRREIDREKRDFEFDRKEINQAKFWDAKLNKVITDIHGNRVRVEEFVTRPASNQVKLIALSKRKNRLDYMWFLQEFNKDLPKDIKGIAFQFEWISKPEIYPIEQTKFISNTKDSLEYSFEGYKPTNVIWDQYNITTWILWPNKITTRINGQIKTVQNNNPFSIIPGMYEYTGKDYSTGGQWYRFDYPWDNTFLKTERFIIDDMGNIQQLYILPENIKKIEENYNIELIYTATEFEGRTIDLIIIPKIFCKYGSNSPFPLLDSALVFY